MSEMSVDVGLNLEATGYTAGMGQAVAITEQYNKVAGGAAGRMIDLNSSLIKLTATLTGFNAVNNAGTDTAAAYQKQLEGIEGAAKVTGARFGDLSKTTKAFARDFPVGMSKAVQIVEDLQSMGIKSNKQIGDLGKSFIKLEAATGASGKEMLQLNKSMGNGYAQFDKLSDSLTYATKVMGGSAPAIVAFSKALAPVATTVGMSQTAVMGLSTAMSSLGEDGYRAANTFNKVLLDMNRSVRNGGPELKAYADLMGTTAENLREMFKTNPAEVLSMFTDSVSQAGPNVSRNLEALGFDSVRDTRSLTALANAGGPRQAIATAVAGYGSGATQSASEAALDGVLDKANELKESMTQTVANISTPMLTAAQGQLGIMKTIASAAASVTGSDAGQATAGVMGYGQLGLQAGVSIVNAASMIALGRLGIRKFGESQTFQKGKAGYRGALDGSMSPEEARSGGFASSMGYAMANPQFVPDEQKTVSQRLRAFGSRTVAVGMDVTGRGVQGLIGNTMEGAQGRDSIRSVSGQQYRDSMGTAFRSMRGSGDILGFLGEGGRATGKYISELGTEDGLRGRTAIGSVARGTAAMTFGTAAKAAGIVGQGIGAMGFNPYMLAGAGVIAGGSMIAQQKAAGDSSLDMVKASGEDIYSSFNDFAEAAGLAGRGLASFTAALAEATGTLANQNTTLEKAYELSSAELSQANSPGYKAAFQIQGDDKSAGSVAAQASAMLGPNARPQEIGRVIMDVANQTSADTAASVADMLKTSMSAGGMSYDALLGNVQSQSNGLFKEFGNAAQGAIGTMVGQKGLRTAYEADAVFGGRVAGVTAGEATRVNEAEMAYNAALKLANDPNKPMSISTLHTMNQAIAQMLGLNEQQSLDLGLGADNGPQATSKALANNMTFDELMAQALAYTGESGVPTAAKNYSAIRGAGIGSGSVDYGQFATQMPGSEYESRSLEAKFNGAANAAMSLSDALYAGEAAARKFGKIQTELTPSELAGSSTAGRAVMAYEQDPTETGKNKAAEALLDAALKGTESGQDYGQAIQALKLEVAKAPDGLKKDALEQAVILGQPRQGLASAGQTGSEANLKAMNRGYTAMATPLSSSNQAYNSNIQTDITIGMGAESEESGKIANQLRAMGAMRTQQMQMARQNAYQASIIQRNAGQQEAYATEDYRQQRAYSREDFGTGMERAERDYKKTRRRARRDFTQSQEYAEEDFGTSRLRAQEDFEKSRLRVIRDFNTQVDRANRDFRQSEARALDDFNKGRLRAQDDYNRQLKRMVEDAAKTLYDPWKRRATQMVMDGGQLLANLRDQQGAMDKQLSQIDELRGMGLSSDAIKNLNLMDTTNAQQVTRLLADAQGNAGMIEQLNSAISQRKGTAEQFVTDKDNTQFSRMQEDFKTSMDRSAEDFELSRQRGRDDFKKSMDDMGRDLLKSLDDSSNDFRQSMDRANADFEKSTMRSVAAFRKQMKDMAKDQKTSVKDAEEDYLKSMDRGEAAFRKSLARMRKATAQALSDMATQSAMAIQTMQEAFVGLGQSAGKGTRVEKAQTLMNQLLGLGISKKDWSDDMIALYNSAKAIVDRHIEATSKPKTTASMAGTYTASYAVKPKVDWGSFYSGSDAMKAGRLLAVELQKGVDRNKVAAPKVIWEGLWSSIPKAPFMKTKVSDAFTQSDTYLKGNSTRVQSMTKWDGLYKGIPKPSELVSSVEGAFTGGKGTTVKTWLGGLDTKMASWMPPKQNMTAAYKTSITNPFVDALNNLGTKWASAKFALPTQYTNGKPIPGAAALAVKPPTWSKIPYALGGIATRQQDAVLAEAGYPEAVIPLNQRGAEVLAATMARYLDKNEVQGAQMERYATSVVNNYQQTYDQRTQYTGAITVQAQDPDDFNRQLEARQRRQRMAQPMGGR